MRSLQKLDAGDAGKLFTRIPYSSRPTSHFELKRFLRIGEQALNFSASLSGFFYGANCEPIEDVGLISVGVDNKLDRLEIVGKPIVPIAWCQIKQFSVAPVKLPV